MAQVPIVEDNHTGDGVTRVYGLTWPYLDKSEVFVSVDGANVPYNWLAGSDSSLQLINAPAVGAKISVYRNTRAFVPLHKFSVGVPFLPRYVDENAEQLLYALQEGISGFGEVSEESAQALLVAQQAEASAAAAVAATLKEAATRAEADANIQDQLTGNVPLLASAFSEISWHGQRINNSVNIPANVNAWSFGPTMTIALGQVVTVGAGASWTIANGATSGDGTLSAEIPSPLDFGAL
ncbi:tail fiber protein [Pseudomonas phage phiB1_1]|uniref:Tail fiber protein n=1 Tax=Pseudomonas phage phiB1_1 TaxID=2755402 RepID=A0A7D7IS78_9CAUD|nr:tail fiber protein [Pseudomonas phage phiB1_1]